MAGNLIIVGFGHPVNLEVKKNKTLTSGLFPSHLWAFFALLDLSSTHGNQHDG
jgi:hypothetical protein